MVEFKERDNSPCEIDCSFYLAVVKQSSIEDNPDDETIETEIPKVYLKVQTLIEFDTFVVTHGPFTSIDGMFFLYNIIRHPYMQFKKKSVGILKNIRNLSREKYVVIIQKY